MIAQCFLSTDNDLKNVVYFDNRNVVIKSKGAIYRFDLKTKTILTIEEKKLMLPLLFGGLGVCFLLLMLWHNLFNPTPILILLMAGLVALYFGWQGNKMLIVYQNGNPFSMPLRAKTDNLEKFVNFFNDYQNGIKNKLIYHITTQTEWDSQAASLYFSAESLASEGFIHAVEKYQINDILEKYFSNVENIILLEINALELDKELKYEQAQNTFELYPHVYGKIIKTSIIGTLLIVNAKEFDIELLVDK